MSESMPQTTKTILVKIALVVIAVKLSDKVTTLKEFVAGAKQDNIKIHLAHHFAFHATQERIRPPQNKRCAKAAQPTGTRTRVVGRNAKNAMIHLNFLPRDKLFVANVKRGHF